MNNWKCIKCGCTDDDCSSCVEAQGQPCYWVAPNKCSRCYNRRGLKNVNWGLIGAMLFGLAVGAVVILLFVGCASMKGKSYKVYGDPVDPNRVTVEYYEASYETLFIDWERHGFRGVIEGFGSVGSDRSRVESEGGGIVKDIAEVASPIKAVKR